MAILWETTTINIQRRGESPAALRNSQIIHKLQGSLYRRHPHLAGGRSQNESEKPKRGTRVATAKATREKGRTIARRGAVTL